MKPAGDAFGPSCGQIDLDALAKDRDQLWAEAKARLDAGSVWWLETAELVQLASDEQTERYEVDPWEEVISRWAADRPSVSISEVLEKCLQKPQGLWTQTDKNRTARCLRALGWERFEKDTDRVWNGDIGGMTSPFPVCSQNVPTLFPVHSDENSEYEAAFSVFPSTGRMCAHAENPGWFKNCNRSVSNWREQWNSGNNPIKIATSSRNRVGSFVRTEAASPADDQYIAARHVQSGP